MYTRKIERRLFKILKSCNRSSHKNAMRNLLFNSEKLFGREGVSLFLWLDFRNHFKKIEEKERGIIITNVDDKKLEEI